MGTRLRLWGSWGLHLREERGPLCGSGVGGDGGSSTDVLYLSFSSWVTRLVMRPHSSPMRKSTEMPRLIMARM